MDIAPLIYLAVGIGCILIYRQLKKNGMINRSELFYCSQKTGRHSV